MLQYRNSPCRAISGASLAQLRRHMAAPERACLAADIIDGRVVLQGLTAKGIAALCGVNLAYFNAALNLTPEQRCEASRGARPLAKAPKRKSAQPFDWNSVNDDDLVEAVRRHRPRAPRHDRGRRGRGLSGRWRCWRSSAPLLSP
jgi:hypothetical protein